MKPRGWMGRGRSVTSGCSACDSTQQYVTDLSVLLPCFLSSFDYWVVPEQFQADIMCRDVYETVKKTILRYLLALSSREEVGFLWKGQAVKTCDSFAS